MLCKNVTVKIQTGPAFGWSKAPLCLVLALLLHANGAMGASFTWSDTGSMVTPRDGHTATLLPNGKVLVVSGQERSSGEINTISCELYDPTAKAWSSAASLTVARERHTATLLSNGKVLVIGGATNSNAGIATCELYDPASDTWSAADTLAAARLWHTATLLPNGKVLVAGGKIPGSALNSSELYDPSSDSWSAAGSLNFVHDAHTATLLSNGMVLVVGSALGPKQSCELYDPDTNTWNTTGSLAEGRSEHAANLLSDGKVLVTGGTSAPGVYLASSELYDPSTKTWSAAAAFSPARMQHTATKLNNGQVFVAGGWNGSSLNSCVLYSPGSNSWSAADNLNTVRSYFVATLLSDGQVLAIGGYPGGSSFLRSCELFDSATPTISSVSPGGGTTAGGTIVTINGTIFASGATVTFGGSTATNINVQSATKITCNSPNHAAGAVDVVVTNPDSQTATLFNGFTYDDSNAPPKIDSGPSSSAISPLEGEIITFSVTGSDSDGDQMTFSWDFGDGTTATGESVTHAYSTADTYTVTVTVSDGKTSVSDSLSQNVFSASKPNITKGPTANPNPVLVNNATQFDVTASNASGAAITINWDFGDGSTGQGPSVQHIYTATGDYTVVVAATDANGQTSKTITVSVTNTAKATGTMSLLKVKLKLNFKKPNRDLLIIQGTLNVPPNFIPEGTKVLIDATGAFGSFTLDAKGKARTDDNGSKNKRFFLKLKFKKGVLQPEAKFKMFFKKGDFQETWAPYGLINATMGPERVSIPMIIETDTTVYPDFLSGDYKAVADRTGQFIGKEGLTIGGQ